VLGEKSQAIEIPALSSQTYVAWPTAEITGLKGFDAKTSFVVAEVSAANRTLSRNLFYFSLPKDMRLPDAKVTSELTGQAGSYKLRVSSKLLARNVFISAGALEASYSDNFFDVPPGDTLEIEIHSAAPADQLRAALKVVSLTDSFVAN
jgi:beta-mannosidase